MEFFEFDNSFISRKGSLHSDYKSGSGDGWDIGGGIKMPCEQVQAYKDGSFKPLATPQQTDAMRKYCIEQMPYQVKSGDSPIAPNKGVSISNKAKF